MKLPLIFMTLGTVALIFGLSCKASITPAETDAYFNAQMACVDAGGTREQIDTCRAKAKTQFNATLLSDGGIDQ